MLKQVINCDAYFEQFRLRDIKKICAAKVVFCFTVTVLLKLKNVELNWNLSYPNIRWILGKCSWKKLGKYLFKTIILNNCLNRLLFIHSCTSLTYSCTSLTHSYTSLTHSYTSLTYSYTSLTHSYTFLTHSYTSLTHSYTFLTHSYTFLTYSCTFLTRSCTSLTSKNNN